MKKSIFCASLLVAGLALADSTEVEVDNVIGVMPVKANGKGQVMLSIPWVEVGGGSDLIAASNLVKTASLTGGPEDPTGVYEGDSLTWYNITDEKFQGWRLVGSGAVTNWQGIVDAKTKMAPAADEPMLARGQALILERVTSNSVVYVIGQVGTNATVTTTIPASDDGKTPKYTLIAPPTASGTAINVNTITFTGTINEKDRIRLEAVGGANTNTELKRKQVTENDKTEWAWVNASNGLKTQAMIPAGRGFIYIRYGTESLSVTWDAPSINN